MATRRDISRTRKAYSYYRPRPVYRDVATESEMNNIFNALTQVTTLNQNVTQLVQNADNIVWNEAPSGVTDGSNVSFELQYTPLDNSKMLVFVNGVLKERNGATADYTIAGKMITFLWAPPPKSKVLVTYSRVTG